jgi:hypothetical protein
MFFLCALVSAFSYITLHALYGFLFHKLGCPHVLPLRLSAFARAFS